MCMSRGSDSWWSIAFQRAPSGYHSIERKSWLMIIKAHTEQAYMTSDLVYLEQRQTDRKKERKEKKIWHFLSSTVRITSAKQDHKIRYLWTKGPCSRSTAGNAMPVGKMLTVQCEKARTLKHIYVSFQLSTQSVLGCISEKYHELSWLYRPLVEVVLRCFWETQPWYNISTLHPGLLGSENMTHKKDWFVHLWRELAE